MAKVFDSKFKQGSLLDGVSNSNKTKVKSNVNFCKGSKGMGVCFKSSSNSYLQETLSFPTNHTVVIDFLNRKNYYPTNPFPVLFSWGRYRYGLYINWGGADPRLIYFTTSYASYLFNRSLIEDGKPHQIILTKNGTSFAIYLDGQLMSTWTDSITDFSGVSDFVINGDRADSTPTATTHWDGDCYRLTVYDEAIDSNEREKVYREFVQSYPLGFKKTEPFVYPKPTDLSSEVDIILGDELTVNGDFATGDLTGWTQNSSGATGASVINEELVYNDNHPDYSETKQLNKCVVGAKYCYSFEVKESSVGNIIVSVGRSFINGGAAGAPLTAGVYTGEVTAVHPDGFSVSARTNSSVAVDNFSIKRITGLVAAYNFIMS